ncbi:twin-arginine translocase subunit TatB [Motiliproteus coralliicola]|uniref:Sec-independent protein translocase protein TatB n=1 Tax=Motiliproteus coralliicola TaxID=2283196 RepID=A0A369WC17_9GAMM|nr:Sec-independent protein translocase protein TatB [Motiliproteus coralliicola]RDE18719.1 twin-arginine translocase subunit TatB [Motiliproteus coralliicola]
MFDIGFTELLIVGVVALIVLGPERLPHAVKTAGMWIGKIKRTLGSVQKEISEELRVEEMRREAKEQQEQLEKQVDSMTKPFHESLREDLLKPSPQPEATATTEASDAPVSPESRKPSAE